MFTKAIVLMLLAVVTAAPLYALEDEYGRLLPLHNEFAENVVTQSKLNIAQDDPGTMELLRACAGLGVLAVVAGLIIWWRGSNPKLRPTSALVKVRAVRNRALRFTKKLARTVAGTPAELNERIASLQARLARIASE